MSSRLRLNFILSMWVYSCQASFVERSILFLLYCISTLVKTQVAMNSGFLGGAVGKESTVVKNPQLLNAGDTRNTSSIPGSERSPGGGQGNPLQYSCLENPMGRGGWQASVLGVAKSWTQLNRMFCLDSIFYSTMCYMYI